MTTKSAPDSATHLPRYIPLAAAARERKLSVAALKRAVQQGTIPAIIMNQQIAVMALADETKPTTALNGNGHGAHQTTEPNDLARPNRAMFAHLAGPEQAVTIQQAADLTEAEGWSLPLAKVTKGAIRAWIRRDYVKVHQSGYRMQVDLADVLLCKAIASYRVKKYGGVATGSAFFDTEGEPNLELRWPLLAEYRRREKLERTKRKTKYD